MAKYIPISELPSSDVVTQSISGNEPDLQLAFEMMMAKKDRFIRHGIMWDIVLPEGADDGNRISLNVSRMDRIRAIGGYSLFHFVDVSAQEGRSHYLGDGGVVSGVRMGIDVNYLTQMTRERYRLLAGTQTVDSPLLAQDIVWADNLEGCFQALFAEAKRDLDPTRAKIVNALVHLPGLIKVKH